MTIYNYYKQKIFTKIIWNAKLFIEIILYMYIEIIVDMYKRLVVTNRSSLWLKIIFQITKTLQQLNILKTEIIDKNYLKCQALHRECSVYLHTDWSVGVQND